MSLVPLPRRGELRTQTETVLANNRLTLKPPGPWRLPRPDAQPRPVPQRQGEPSVFRHVLYIIKENRTYDQVLGDMQRGEGDPRLCLFGRAGDAEPSRIGRAIRAAGQLLLQRRAQRRRPPSGPTRPM